MCSSIHRLAIPSECQPQMAGSIKVGHEMSKLPEQADCASAMKLPLDCAFESAKLATKPSKLPTKHSSPRTLPVNSLGKRKEKGRSWHFNDATWLDLIRSDWAGSGGLWISAKNSLHQLSKFGTLLFLGDWVARYIVELQWSKQRPAARNLRKCGWNCPNDVFLLQTMQTIVTSIQRQPWYIYPHVFEFESQLNSPHKDP